VILLTNGPRVIYRRAIRLPTDVRFGSDPVVSGASVVGPL
jgi:hypothetical protein